MIPVQMCTSLLAQPNQAVWKISFHLMMQENLNFLLASNKIKPEMHFQNKSSSMLGMATEGFKYFAFFYSGKYTRCHLQIN